MSEVVVRGGGGRNEGGELEAEALHVQPAVLLHVLALHLAAPVGDHGSSAAALPPALHFYFLEEFRVVSSLPIPRRTDGAGELRLRCG